MDPSVAEPDDPVAEVPLGQRLYDNMYLLLVLGVLVMLIVFTAWGMWEVLSMPADPLP